MAVPSAQLRCLFIFHSIMGSKCTVGTYRFANLVVHFFSQGTTMGTTTSPPTTPLRAQPLKGHLLVGPPSPRP